MPSMLWQNFCSVRMELPTLVTFWMSPFQYHGSDVGSLVRSMNIQTLYGSEALLA